MNESWKWARLALMALAFFVLAGAPGALAEPAQVVQGSFEFALHADEGERWAVVRAYLGAGGAVTIPASVTHQGTPYPVTTIGESVFADKPALTGVTIPGSVKSLGAKAFARTSIARISIPKSCIYIAEDAFEGCPQLELEVPGDGYRAYRAIRNIAKVRVGAGATYIADRAFEDWTGLTDVHLPEGVARIGDSAFKNCREMQTISMPKSVTKIGNSAFADCWALKTLPIPPSLAALGDYAFRDCDGLTSVANLPASLQSIGTGVFSGCGKLQSVTIPATIKAIPNEMFKSCVRLETVNLASGVRSIGNNAFEEAPLRSISLPNTLQSIGDEAFRSSNLAKLSAPASLLSVGQYAFASCYELTDVSLPGATNIGQYAFWRCYGLATVKVPKLTAPGEYMLAECTQLKSVELGAGLTRLSAGMFEECTALASISLPAGLTEIGENAFAYCESLSSVAMPSSIKKIERYAFYRCHALKTIPLPSSLTSVGNGAFMQSGLSQFSWPASLSGIGDDVFNYCDFVSVNIPNTVTSIGANAFHFCLSLEKVLVPASVTSIASTAFDNCPKLKMYGYAGSYAEAYARNRGMPFVVVSGVETLYIEGPNALYRGDEAAYAVRRMDGQPVGNRYSWSSGDPAVATIDQTGRLRAVRGGETVITARDADKPALSATLKLTVTSLATEITLAPLAYELEVDEVIRIAASIMPADVTDSTLYWSSSQNDVATVSADGTVRGVSPGTARIVARANNGVSGSMDLTVVAPSSDVRIVTPDGQSGSADLAEGKSMQLRAVSRATGAELDVYWGPYDSSTVAVGPNGLIYGAKEGIAYVGATLKSDPNAHGKIRIRVVTPVTKVALDKTSLEMKLGATATLVATVSPPSATEPGLSWTSSEPFVVAVSGNGNLTALGAGKAVITATSVNKLSASCEVTVVSGWSGPDSLRITSEMGDSALLFPKQKLQLSASAAGVTWKSSAPSYVSVGKTGLLTAKKSGKTVTITARLGAAAASFTVKVVKKPTSIKIPAAAAYTNAPPVQMKYALSPKGAGCRAVTWSVEGDAATISADGLLTPVRDGTVTVRATTDTGKTARRVVQIRTLPSSIALSPPESTLKVKAKLRLSAAMDGTEPFITWRSSSKKIATVSKSGVVKGVKAGTVTITATTRNGLTATCTVRVVKKLPSASPTPMQASPAPPPSTTPLGTPSPSSSTPPSPTPGPAPLPSFDPELLP